MTPLHVFVVLGVPLAASAGVGLGLLIDAVTRSLF